MSRQSFHTGPDKQDLEAQKMAVSVFKWLIILWLTGIGLLIWLIYIIIRSIYRAVHKHNLQKQNQPIVV